MKKILTLIAGAIILAQTALAQVCAFQVDADKVYFNGKEVDIHDAGSILEKSQTDWQDIFVYVNYDTPIGLANDLKAIIEGSCTAGVVFVNPERSGDSPRLYGPKMAYHSNFLEMEMLRKAKIATFKNTNDEVWDFILEGARADDYAYNSSRMLNYIRTPHDKGNAVTEWTNNFDGVVLNLAYQTPMGVLYSLENYLNQESLPYINVVYHTIETPLCPELWFQIRDAALEDYSFETVPAGNQAKALYNGHDLKYFSDHYHAYQSISALEGMEARPGKGRAIVEFEITPLGTVRNVKIQRPASLKGLDEVIIDHMYGLQGLWAPQFVKGQPVNVKVSCPVYGEISQW